MGLELGGFQADCPAGLGEPEIELPPLLLTPHLSTIQYSATLFIPAFIHSPLGNSFIPGPNHFSKDPITH